MLLHHCRNKDFQHAKEIKAELDQQNFVYTPFVIVQLLDVSVASEDLKYSQQLFSQLKDSFPDFILDDYKILNYVALLVGKDQVDEAVKVFNEWSPRADRADDDFLEKNVWQILNAFSVKGNVELTENMWKLIIDKRCCRITSIILGPVIKVYLENNDLDNAVARFEEFAETYSCTPLRNLLFVKLIEKEDHKNLQKIFDLNVQIHGELNTLHDLAFSFIQCGKTAGALKIFKTPGMRGLQDRLDNYCRGLMKSSRLRELEDLISVTKNLFGTDRDKLYQYLIRGYYEAEDPKKALGVWTLMQEEDLCPSERTRNLLANIREFSEPVPFVVPDEQAKVSFAQMQEQIPTNARTGQVQIGGNRMAPESALQSSQTSERICSMVQYDKLDEALEIVHHCLDKKQHLLPQALKSVLNELARNGDVDRLEVLEPKLNTITKKTVHFNNVILQAHIYRGTHEEILLKLEMNVSETDLCPAGTFLFLLNRHPELLERVETLANKYTKHDYYGLLNSIWMHHFMNENYDAAHKIFEETPKLSAVLKFRGILNEASNIKHIPMLERLLQVVKRSQLPNESLAGIYEKMMDIQCVMQDTDGALKTLENAKKDGVENCIHPNIMLKVKTSLERSGHPMP